MFAYDLTLAVDEHLTAKVERGDSGASNYRRDELHHLGVLASHLLEYDVHADPYRGMTEHQRNSCRIEESMNVKATVQDGYDPERYWRMGSRPSHNPKCGHFTPRGLVVEPSEDFQQKVIAIDVERRNIFTEDARFNLSSAGHLYLYTDNASVEPPLWEYHDRDTPPDMFPSRHHDPYFFHAVPPQFIHEKTAFAVVESLARVFATSSRDEHAKQEANS